MPLRAHFIDVGQGNMTLLQMPDGATILYDCNVTDENEDRVLAYLRRHTAEIDLFINSHRDCDHFNGVRRVHSATPIRHIWDCGVTGSSPSESAYEDYMALRREVGFSVPPHAGTTRAAAAGNGWAMCVLASGDSLDPNCGSTVVRIAHNGASVMLAGDSDGSLWRDRITRRLPMYMRSTVLVASHHGSMSFFEARPRVITGLRKRVPGAIAPWRPNVLQALTLRSAPNREVSSPFVRRRLPPQKPAVDLYVDHVALIRPVATIVSVGPNSHGHPVPEALRLYERYTTGPPVGDQRRLWRTDELGTIVFTAAGPQEWELRGSS